MKGGREEGRKEGKKQGKRGARKGLVLRWAGGRTGGKTDRRTMEGQMEGQMEEQKERWKTHHVRWRGRKPSIRTHQRGVGGLDLRPLDVRAPLYNTLEALVQRNKVAQLTLPLLPLTGGRGAQQLGDGVLNGTHPRFNSLCVFVCSCACVLVCTLVCVLGCWEGKGNLPTKFILNAG